MSEYNEGQAIAESQWLANSDVANNRIDSGRYGVDPWYRHEYDYRKEQARPIEAVDVPDLFPSSSSGTGTSASSSYSSSGDSASGSSDGFWTGLFGLGVLMVAMPAALWVVGVAVSRAQPWAQGVLEIGRTTGLFGSPTWLVVGLIGAALIGQWVIALVAADTDEPLLAVLLVALTLFAGTEAVKAVLAFAHAPDFGCRAALSWIPQACGTDLWSIAKGIVAWTGLGALTGLAAWAMTVVTAILYLVIGFMAQLAALAPAVAMVARND